MRQNEDCSLGDGASDNSEKLLQGGGVRGVGGWGEEPGYIRVLQPKEGSREVKRLLLIKENQISQVKEFSAFLCMGKCKSLGSLKLCL